VAVGGGYVMEGSNSGLMIYNKQGEYVMGVSQKCFNNGIDPKLAFDIHNQVFYSTCGGITIKKNEAG